MEVNKLNNLPPKSSIEIKDGILTKTLISDNPVWIEKFNTEKACYIAFKENPINVKAPYLISSTQNSLQLKFIEGAAICDERYLETSIDKNLIKKIAIDIHKINSYPSPITNKTDYIEKIQKYSAKGFMHTAIAEKLLSAIKNIAVDEFNHGDMLLKNIILTAENNIAFIDWEFAGLYIKGYDLALLHTTLTADRDAQKILEDEAKNTDIYNEFIINKAIVIARELKIHQELDDNLDFKHKRLSALKNEELMNNQRINQLHIFN